MEAVVVDPSSGKRLPPNEQGELWVRGPNIMQGYLNNPEATASTLDGDGWLHTGDLGYIDEDGNLYIMDRLKELIKYKGLQIVDSGHCPPDSTQRGNGVLASWSVDASGVCHLVVNRACDPSYVCIHEDMLTEVEAISLGRSHWQIVRRVCGAQGGQICSRPDGRLLLVQAASES
ncbi:hypothetical protein L7F22_027627 [Adiantum nelumboides]|nr:hypothetical protein [Adiantum nelumboides]